MDRLGWSIGTYYSSEFDKYPRSQTEINFPDIIHLGDVRTVDPSKLESIDILIGWSPCQDLSTAKANGKGLEWEKSSLFFEYVRILKECKPTYFLLENVASMRKADRDKITEIMGVEPILINSALVSAQNRKRLYWTNIPGVQEPEDKGVFLDDILEDVPFEKWRKLDDKYCQNINDIAIKKARTVTASYWKWACLKNVWTHRERTLIFWQFRRSNIRIHANQDKSCTLTANMGTGGNNVPIILGSFSIYNKSISPDKSTTLGTNPQCVTAKTGQIIIWYPQSSDSHISDGIYWRILTPIECERLQTLPDNFTKDLSNTRRYKAIGNGWTVDVIAHIFSYCKFEEEEKAAPEKTRAQKLQYLHKCMIRYSDIKGVSVEELLEELYRDYCITSRGDLLDHELDKVIEYYLSV